MGEKHRFGEFHYDADEARLLRGEVELELQPKLHHALRLFLARRGELIGKDELLGALWPGAEVNEEALTQLVKRLRRALDDDAQEPRHLQTVLKRGYRFLAEAAAPAPAAPPPAAAAPPRAATASAPRAAPQPPRAAYDPRWYVSRPEEEARARACLAVPGMPLVLLAPERFGKTWLLRHLLREARAAGARVVALNLDLLDAPAWTSLESCLRELGRELAAATGLPDGLVDRVFARSQNPKANLNWLLEREILPAVAAEGVTLLLAIDRADAAWDRPFRDELFGLLRAWAENGAAEEGWPCLRLLLAISTSPALLISDPSQSPFNLSEPVRLRDLGDPQLEELARLHGLPLDAGEREALRGLVGGHPYLVRVLLAAACARGQRVGALLADGAATGEAFAAFLDHTRARLERQPGLQAALAQVAQGRGPPLLPEHARRLAAAGLITRDERSGEARLRYRLFERLS